MKYICRTIWIGKQNGNININIQCCALGQPAVTKMKLTYFQINDKLQFNHRTFWFISMNYCTLDNFKQEK